MSSNLQALFEQARIPLETAAAPLRPLRPEVFQMDLSREPVERIQIWTGARDNELEVLSVDDSLGQLVLRVREARRVYEDRVRVRDGRVTRRQIDEFLRESGGGQALHPRGSSWVVERYTDPAERRFLVGFDQRHLFAAQLPSGDTVREAHEALKPAGVREAERRWPGRTVRQGEWFFAPSSAEEESEVYRHLAVHVHLARRKGRLGEGEPHWAEQMVELPAGRLFVRGTVHHRDHCTVAFDRWRAVHLNTAIRRPSGRARGFHWID